MLKLFAKALLCAKLQHYLHLTSRWIRIFSRHTTWLFPCHKVRRSCKIRKIKELQKQRALPFLSATSSAVTQPSRPNFPSSVTTRSTIRRRNWSVDSARRASAYLSIRKSMSTRTRAKNHLFAPCVPHVSVKEASWATTGKFVRTVQSFQCSNSTSSCSPSSRRSRLLRCKA